MKTKRIFTILILTTICLIFVTLSAQAIDYPEIGRNVPGTTLEGYVRYIYLFALSIVGIAALGAITFGGITYMLSDTITSKDEAKKWIWGAVTGLILALAAYLILYTINPDLVSLRGLTLPSTGSETTPSPSTTSGECTISPSTVDDQGTPTWFYRCSLDDTTSSGRSRLEAKRRCEERCVTNN